MAAISHYKEDLSVDNVHTPFGLTKNRPAPTCHAKNMPKRDRIFAGSRSHVVPSTPTHEEA